MPTSLVSLTCTSSTVLYSGDKLRLAQNLAVVGVRAQTRGGGWCSVGRQPGSLNCLAVGLYESNTDVGEGGRNTQLGGRVGLLLT